jgi:nuclear GTP-binding protein
MATEPTLSSLAALASETQAGVDRDAASYAGSSQKTKEQLRRHYVRMLHKVIDQSDIVILVLDARDPEGCRSRLVEEEVRRRESEGKKLVFVLNKIGMNIGFILCLHSYSPRAVDKDLVSKENAQQWLRYLRHSTPTLPFRSASSNQRSNLSSTTAPGLMRLLKAFKPSSQSITVGVVGFPNVGKSSLINSLKRSKVSICLLLPVPNFLHVM